MIIPRTSHGDLKSRLVFALTLAILCILAETRCSRPMNVQNGRAGAPSTPEPGSFQGESHQGESRTSSSSGSSGVPVVTPAAQVEAMNPDGGPPFRERQSLPAGTLLTVRLKGPVSSGGTGADSGFSAVVDEPVIVDGETLVPRGTAVAGRIESARAPQGKGQAGHLRLTLEHIDWDGREVSLRTASLFARGNVSNSSSATSSGNAGGQTTVSLEKGRRLTFHLIESVSLVALSINPAR